MRNSEYTKTSQKRMAPGGRIQPWRPTTSMVGTYSLEQSSVISDLSRANQISLLLVIAAAKYFLSRQIRRTPRLYLSLNISLNLVTVGNVSITKAENVTTYNM